MSTEACTLALRNALDEIKNVCPDITSTFVFEENGKIVIEDQVIPDLAISNAQEAFRALSERAAGIGGIQSVTFQGSDSKANITRFNNFYVTNVASNEADEKTVINLTKVMIPTMLRLVQDIYPSSQEPLQEAPQAIENEPEPEQETSITLQPHNPELQPRQFTVEPLGFTKFLSNPHMVRIDSALISEWKELYGDEPITQINIQNPTSQKTIRCEFNIIKESKNEGKGIIQVPEKIQLAIETQKGTKVLVTPVLKNQDDPKGVMGTTEPETEETEPESKTEMSHDSESYLSTAPQTQFIVENLKGLGSFIGVTDCIRLDNSLISQWKELFGKQEITEVIVQETVTGKRIKCKFQGIKDSSLEGKGVIQIPEKMQQALETKKGALVVVKPVVD